MVDSSSNTSKTILITGASSGFGKLTVERLIERGHTVVAGMRGGHERLKSVFGEEAASSTRLKALDLHMEKSDGFEEVVEFVRTELGGKLDVLINNAGYGLMGPLEAITPHQLRHQFDVNVFGPIFLARALLPFLRERRGRVINVTSVVGLATFPFYGAYSSTKYALEAATEGLYYDLKPQGVQVAMVEPGGFRTEFAGRNLRFGENAESPELPYRRRVESFRKVFREKMENGGGNPARVARLLARLSEKRRIRLRNVIGADATALVIAKRLIPDRLRVALSDFVFRVVMFSK